MAHGSSCQVCHSGSIARVKQCLQESDLHRPVERVEHRIHLGKRAMILGYLGDGMDMLRT